MDKHLKLASLTLLWSLVAASCGGGSSSSSTEPAPPCCVVRNLSPTAVDPAATTATSSDYHVVVLPVAEVAARNKLFVFMPGTDGVPNQYELILKAGARRGFHAIGLNYPNSTAVGVLCLTSTDQNCFWNVRRAIITGQPVSVDISVTQPNAIVTRLTKAVAYLNVNYPTEGWGQYLLGSGALDWSKIVVGGHSQGGGHAGVMAKTYSMSRACYFASPPDWNAPLGNLLPPNAPAAWESFANVTPASLQFGFGGLSDSSVPPNQLSVIWQTIGLAGPAVSVDSNSPPYGGSHILTTNAAPNTSTGAIGTPSHGLTVRDAFTPIDTNGQPVFDAAWGYLCFQ
jgi:hypothetical protein